MTFLHIAVILTPSNILSVGTDSSEPTVQTQIRLLLKECSGRDLFNIPFSSVGRIVARCCSAAELVFDVPVLLSFYGIHKLCKNFSHRKHLFRAT